MRSRLAQVCGLTENSSRKGKENKKRGKDSKTGKKAVRKGRKKMGREINSTRTDVNLRERGAWGTEKMQKPGGRN